MVTKFEEGYHDGFFDGAKPKFPENPQYMKGFEISKHEGDAIRHEINHSSPDERVQQKYDKAIDETIDLCDQFFETVKTNQPNSNAEAMAKDFLRNLLCQAYCRGAKAAINSIATQIPAFLNQ